jgi:hypothetical protein
MREGAPVSFNANRARLLRALELGLNEIHFASDEVPVLCQAGNARYAWAPFSKEGVIPASDDAVRLTSAAAGNERPSAARRRAPKAAPANGDKQPSNSEPNPVGPTTRKRRLAHGKQAGGADGLIQKAEAVHASLRETLLQNRELLKALKQHRRQTRLVRTTLSSLKELQGIGA